MSTEKFDLERFLRPTPKERISNPKKTEVNVGDIVKSKIGLSKGNIGIVVVERNANYLDKLGEICDDSIGVSFAEHENIEPILEKITRELAGRKNDIEVNIRWFDDTSQFEIIASAKDNNENIIKK